MRKIIIVLSIVCCVFAQDYSISKNADGEPCYDDATGAIRDAEAKIHFKAGYELADQAFLDEGTIDAKFELYKTYCKQIKYKVILGENLLLVPICNATDIKKEFFTKAELTEAYFGFMCNLNKEEYIAFTRETIEHTSNSIGIVRCTVANKQTNNQKGSYDAFCRPMASEQLSCFQAVFAEQNHSMAFFDAQLTFWKKMLCVDGVTDEQSTLKFKQLFSHFQGLDTFLESTVKKHKSS